MKIRMGYTFNPSMHNVVKWPDTLKILRCSQIFVVCLAILQQYAQKG